MQCFTDQASGTPCEDTDCPTISLLFSPHDIVGPRWDLILILSTFHQRKWPNLDEHPCNPFFGVSNYTASLSIFGPPFLIVRVYFVKQVLVSFREHRLTVLPRAEVPYDIAPILPFFCRALKYKPKLSFHLMLLIYSFSAIQSRSSHNYCRTIREDHCRNIETFQSANGERNDSMGLGYPSL